MKAALCLAVIAVIYCTVESKYSAPKVMVYSRNPGEYGKDNVIICHDWHFHLTKHASFTPREGESYTCKVTHGSHEPKIYKWESNM
uniref:Beta-2-microglobulin, like n=1 Tax=Amphilophus citrinellus TaxID=61819 RepID=A0A3Q0RBX0_AMPCI